eukprot:TRINITY_DN9328_c0_g3_i1.p1 TRINITY_DN9328_c0_g3~~TRINITY_DN9328_c0_g3_i1.p1  ORF type:complete len:679 (+),score=139.08 TRINITY_DN9328_c0_g3_i1:47-2083(+)
MELDLLSPEGWFPKRELEYQEKSNRFRVMKQPSDFGSPNCLAFLENKRRFAIINIFFTNPDESTHFISEMEKILRKGIRSNGLDYFFIGHSNSQLGEDARRCYFVPAKSAELAYDLVFGSMVDPSWQADHVTIGKRLGQLLSRFQQYVELGRDIEIIPDLSDVVRNGRKFTDGCGLISKDVAQAIGQKTYRGEPYLASVYQIRIRSFKGVLSLDEHSKSQIHFRPSMNKFTPGAELKNSMTLGIMKTSQPHTFGHLNKQIIALLLDRGISPKTILQMHDESISRMRKMNYNHQYRVIELLQRDQVELAHKYISNGWRNVQPQKQPSKPQKEKSKEKLKMIVYQSRLVFGIADAYSCLKEGQCFIRTRFGKSCKTILGRVLVTRNPCYHPGDLRILEAVQVPELNHLSECIVFSTQGARPPPDEMSGGDLDGDLFFVCWDPRLIPQENCDPANYSPGQRTSVKKSARDSVDDRAKYLAHYSNLDMGEIDSLFWRYYAKNGFDDNCRELAQYFSNSVDKYSNDQAYSRLQELKRDAPDVEKSFLADLIKRQQKAYQLEPDRSSPEISSLEFGKFLCQPQLMFLMDVSEAQALLKTWKESAGRQHLADVSLHIGFDDSDSFLSQDLCCCDDNRCHKLHGSFQFTNLLNIQLEIPRFPDRLWMFRPVPIPKNAKLYPLDCYV